MNFLSDSHRSSMNTTPEPPTSNASNTRESLDNHAGSITEFLDNHAGNGNHPLENHAGRKAETCSDPTVARKDVTDLSSPQYQQQDDKDQSNNPTFVSENPEQNTQNIEDSDQRLANSRVSENPEQNTQNIEDSYQRLANSRAVSSGRGLDSEITKEEKKTLSVKRQPSHGALKITTTGSVISGDSW